jgi:hypothetical protein
MKLNIEVLLVLLIALNYTIQVKISTLYGRYLGGVDGMKLGEVGISGK